MKLVIKNSSVLENGAAKPVTVAQMEFGELALNYNTVDPTIFFKDSTNIIRGFKLGIQPDIDNANNQSGTYDDRYLRADVSSTVTGSITAQNFIGGVSRIGATPPAASSVGELWYNTNDGRLYIYYQDVDSGQWVDAAPDTYEFAENYYTKSETNSLFAYNSGDTFTGTVNFDGTANSSIVSTTSVNGVTFSSYTADGSHFSLSAGLGTTGDQGYRVLNTGTFESYTPQSSDGTAIKAFRVFQGTTENAFITAAGAGTFTSISGDGSNISELSGAVVKAAIEAEPDTNVFSDNDATKLDGIELGATADQTGAEIKAAYEAEADTNAFTDANQTKLDGIEDSATADQTAAEIRLLINDATDSNVFTDSDKAKLDGIETGAEVNVVTSVNGQTGDVTVSGGGGGGGIDVQEFSASGTWLKPGGAQLIVVEVIGAGGGGGSGVNVANTNQSGGSGAAGGQRVQATFFNSEVGASEIITIGSGGTGGVGTQDFFGTLTGNDGAAGGSSSFGSLVTALGGNGGDGARPQTVEGAAAKFVYTNNYQQSVENYQYIQAPGGTSYAGVTGAEGGGNGADYPGGGGGGGNTRNDGYFYPAGQGGLGFLTIKGSSAWSGDNSGGPTGSGTPVSTNGTYGSGWGGGGGTANVGGPGDDGGNGGFPGGGGGGGGAAFSPNLAGNGGNGGGGRVRVITYL